MTWNYRAIEHIATDPDNASKEYYVGVYEVYYNEDGSIMGRSADPFIIGATLKEVLETLERIKKDITNKPILNDTKIEYSSEI